MRQLRSLILAGLMICATGLALRPLDGKWTGEMKAKERTVPVTLDVAAKTIMLGKKKTAELRDLKVDGDTITFSTLRRTKKGERTLYWTGKLDGEELKLTTGTRRRTNSVTLKRAL